MESHRPLRHPKNLADFPVRLAVLYPIQDGHFTWGQFFRALFLRGSILPRCSHEGEMEMASEVLHELSIPLSVDVLPSGKGIKRGETASRVDGTGGDSISQPKSSGCFDKVQLLFGRRLLIG